MGIWSKQDVSRVALRLTATYPASDLGNPVQPLDNLLYIILSGQTNEPLYQGTFEALKAAFPQWHGLAQAAASDIEKVIAGGGLANQKAGYIKAIMERIEADRGEPSLDHLRELSTEEAEKYLTSLPGVGIKSARCVLMYALHREVFPADVNCLRTMERLGWIDWGGRRAELLAGPAQALVPPQLRRSLHVGFVQHGRATCTSANPDCENCCLQDLCETSGKRRQSGPTVVDLCCGAGGFSWGFMQAGCEVRLGVDTDRHALATYAANLPETKTLQLDITRRNATQEILTNLNGQRPEIVIAGPPCQGFSRAGPRKPDDPRNKILNAAVRTAVKLQPKVIVLENVLNLRGPAFIPHLRKAMAVVRSASYRFEYAVVDSATFGVPQTRQRIVFIATRTGTRGQLLKALDLLTKREVVQGMSVASAFDGLAPEGGILAYNHEMMIHGQKVIDKIAQIKPGEGPLSYRKLDPHQLAPTVVCGHRALPCHYAVPRTISAREAARLQGFPDDFKFLGSRSHHGLQVANAVPPRLALGIAMAVLELLGVGISSSTKLLLDKFLRRMRFQP